MATMNSSWNMSSSPYRYHGQHSSVRGRDDPAEFYKCKISALTLNRQEEDQRVEKKRSVSMFHENQWFSLQLALYNNSKSGLLTQPGQGIWKVVDLFHDLINLLGKAGQAHSRD